MLRHIVLLHFTDDVTEADLERIASAVRRLPDRIESIRSYLVAPDIGLAPGNASLAIVADFDGEPGYTQYRDHPDHRRVIDEHIVPGLAHRSAIQVEIDG